jgi:integrase/recombinase XerD
MNPLNRHLEDYLKLRRHLGFQLRLSGRLLRKFVSFAEQEKASFITTDLALRWATQPIHCQPALWANRLGMVRRFAQYQSGSDARTEVPPPGLLPHRFQRRAPYLYCDREIRRLIEAARELDSPKALRGATAATLFGLLAATGMRVGEVVGLNREDIDLPQALLTVRHAKGNQSRLVPLHASTATVLRRYEHFRNQICPHPQSPRFFVSEQGTRLTAGTIRYWFIRVSHRIGLRQPTDRHGPRLHDLRHRFAIRTLLRWYRTDRDVEAQLPELTTYLGHAHVADTYWYLSATPELLQLAARRWERAKGGPLS